MTRRPLLIAHRGASGYLPEHTLVAKALACGQGADFVEQDVVATRDGELLVCHDLYLDAITDVASRFPGRARGDGRHYCIDFDLAELRELRVHERVLPGTDAPRFPNRFPRTAGSFPLVTLREELRFVAGLNEATGRNVGVYPEIKEPAFHRQHGLELGDLVLAALAEAGATLPAFVQCFDPAEVRRLRAGGCPYPLVQLVDAGTPANDLAALGRDGDVLGIDLRLLVGTPGAKALLSAARAAGQAIHAWTVRSDALPAGYTDVGTLLDTLCVDLGIDGVFTDQPDRVFAWRDTRRDALGAR